MNLFHRNLVQKEIQKMQTRKERKPLIQEGKRILFYKPKVLQKSLTTTNQVVPIDRHTSLVSRQEHTA